MKHKRTCSLFFVATIFTLLLLSGFPLDSVQAEGPIEIPGRSESQLPRTGQPEWSNNALLDFHETLNSPSGYESPVIQTSDISSQALNCNPTGGSGGLAVGTHDTIIAGQPATVIVGAGYDPSKPTYLAFYLHGDGGWYDVHDHPGGPLNQFISNNGWIYVAPQAPEALTEPGAYPWDGREGGSIADNATLVKDVLDHMFAKYNVCRDILFGGSTSGGSWFYDYYFFPENGGTYPAFMNLVCGASGINAGTPGPFYGNIQTLGGNADIVSRSDFKYTIGDGDFMYADAQQSVATYSNAGFSVTADYLPGVGHCMDGATISFSEKIRDYWQEKSGALPTMVKDINPNPAPNGDSDPKKLNDVDDKLFFAADDGTNGKELWKSDGTTAGTVMVKDINTKTDCDAGGESRCRYSAMPLEH